MLQIGCFSPCDFVFLQLSRKAQLNDKVQTIRLPRTNDKIKEKQKCRVAGWGCNKRGGKVVDVLQVAEVPIVKLEMCKKQWKKTKFDLPANVTCAGGPNKGFCQVCFLRSLKMVFGSK